MLGVGLPKNAWGERDRGLLCVALNECACVYVCGGEYVCWNACELECIWVRTKIISYLFLRNKISHFLKQHNVTIEVVIHTLFHGARQIILLH